MDMTTVVLVIAGILLFLVLSLVLWLTKFFRTVQALAIVGIFLFTDYYLANPETSPVTVETLNNINTFILCWFVVLCIGYIPTLIRNFIRNMEREMSDGGGSGSSTGSRKKMKYTIYKRAPSGYEYKVNTSDSDQFAISQAKNQLNSTSNRGCFFRVVDSNGSTIWTGQA